MQFGSTGTILKSYTILYENITMPKLHWIGSKFDVCRFLESKQKSSSRGNDQRKEKEKKRNMCSCCGLCLQLTKYTVFPSNENDSFFTSVLIVYCVKQNLIKKFL